MDKVAALIPQTLGGLSGLRTSWLQVICLGFATAYSITVLVTYIVFSGLEDTCVAHDPAHPEKQESEWHKGKKAAFFVVLFGIIGALLCALVPFVRACAQKYYGM